MSRKVLRAVLAAVLVQAALVLVYLGLRDRGATGAFAHERLPDTEKAAPLDLEDAAGAPAPLPAGRPVLVHFWATWCPPCKDEMPALLALGDELERAGIELRAVSVDEGWDEVRRFFHGTVPRRVVRLRDQGHRRYGVSTLPDTYLVSSAGTIVLRAHGPRDWSLASAREAVVAAVRAGGPVPRDRPPETHGGP